MKRFTVAIGLLLAALYTPLTDCAVHAQTLWNQGQPSPKRELRAVWLTTLSGLDWPRTKATDSRSREKQKQELCQMLDQLQRLNINTILFQTRIRGSVVYPSKFEPWDICLTGTFGKSPGYDPLAFAIEETHRRGMEFHAWVVTIPAFKVEAVKKMGKQSLLYTHPELMKKHNGQYYLDPGLPGTADYLSAVLNDFIGKYDIDGIHFDYIRYPENAPAFPDDATYKLYGKGQNKNDWRRDNITRIVRRLYHEVKARKPWVKMSCSPVGKYSDTKRQSAGGWNARDAVHQDAQGWLREGIQDMLFPMMYFTGRNFYPFAIDWKEGSYGRYVAPGLGIYFLHPAEKNWDLSVVTQELNYLRRQGLSGQAFFRSRFLTENTKGLYDWLRNGFYAHPTLPPCYSWLDSIAPSRPAEVRLVPTEGRMGQLQWQPATDDSPGGVRYNVYASPTYPVDTQNAENLIASLLPEPRYTFNRYTAWTNGLYFAITAIDRCGNESEAVQCNIYGQQK